MAIEKARADITGLVVRYLMRRNDVSVLTSDDRQGSRFRYHRHPDFF